MSGRETQKIVYPPLASEQRIPLPLSLQREACPAAAVSTAHSVDTHGQQKGSCDKENPFSDSPWFSLSCLINGLPKYTYASA